MRSYCSSPVAMVAATLACCLVAANFALILAQESSPASQDQDQGDAMESLGNVRSVQASPQDMETAASHHGHSHGKYYMYTEVPKKGAYKMGFKRGNEKHMIERKEKVHKSHVESYFKWHDKKGKGSHKFEFKHSDHKKGHHY